MKTASVSVARMVTFLNGKAAEVKTEGLFPVYGSNGQIGFLNEYNHENAIILGRVGAYCGSIALCESKFWASDNTIVLKPQEGYDLRYLRYRLASWPLRSYAGGAAQPLLTHTILSGVKIPVITDVVEQARIASILAAYDDLIENNRRRIQLLEESARLLYKEWFVHLRFPGHERVKIKDGVPEGWERKKLGEIASLRSGFAFKSSDWEPTGNPVIKIANITEDGQVDIDRCDRVSDQIASAASRFTIDPGSLLIAMTGATIGKVGIMPQSENVHYLNQRVGQFVSRDFPGLEAFLYPCLTSETIQVQIRNLAGGAAQPNISGTQIESIEVLVASREILVSYIETASKLFHQRQVLLSQTRKAKVARDLLLPKLMSGEVVV